MKKIINLIYIFLVCFLFCDFAYAKTIVVISGDAVRVRDKASTSGSVLGNVNKNDQFDLIDLNTGSAGNGCSKDWFKISYNGKTGFVCSQFAYTKEIEDVVVPAMTEEDYENYHDYLISLGFPESYIPYLITIHEKRPSWKFSVMNVDMDFNYVVSKEHTSSGRSLIEDYNRTIDGYKSLASWSYNYFTDVFSTNFSGGGSRWYAASTTTIAYYMDPRNFLNEKQVFMFESQSYNASLHTLDGIKKMLKGTFMENKPANDEGKTCADAFLDGARLFNVSPYVLISRVIQEVGSNGSVIVSGTVSGYEGYYNFYNIGAYGNSASETIANGLKKAKAEGWNTIYKAIVGGAEFIGDNYLRVGQDTLYLNKWDLIGPDYFNHQYMQNIQAPASESKKTYNGYSNINMLDSDFVFSIPVFKNMPNSTSLPNKGNPNNYLSSLSVNGAYLFNTPDNNTEYSLNLAASTKDINIAASKVSSKSSVSGTGSVSLSSAEEIFPVVVTAENGSVRTYNIKITRDSEEALAISEILNVSNIRNDGVYIMGIKLGTDLSNLISLLKSNESRLTITVTDISGKEKVSGIIASGDKLKLNTGTEEKEFTVIIYGDVNSDGKITSADYIKIKNHIMETNRLSDLELLFADANKDNKVTSADYVAIKNHIMETNLIVQ